MEIRNILRGEPASFSARPARQAEKDTSANDGSAADRVELSRQWVEQMENQRFQLLALLGKGNREDQDSGGVLGYMETEEDKLDALSKQLKIQQKCLKIAMRIMQGKKVPPQDEQYLMEHDPNGYKLAMALRRPPKKDEKECESVLDDEDKQSGGTSDSAEAAPAFAGAGAPAASDSGETAE